MTRVFLFLLGSLQLLNAVLLICLLTVSATPRQGAIMYLMFLPHLCASLLLLSVAMILIGTVCNNRWATAYGGLMVGVVTVCWGIGILIEG